MKKITIIFASIFILVLLIAGVYALNKKINVGGVKISSQQYKEISDYMPYGQFMLCSIEQDKCTKINKVSLEGYSVEK